MMNYFADAAFEFEAPPPETILLEESHIERARQLTRKIPNESRRWQSYLNALALFAFEEWLLERAPELTIESDNCTIFQAQYANAIEAVCNLKIGEFKLCLVAMGSLTDRTIAFPRAAIDLPEFSAHFYVVVEVIEELEQAIPNDYIHRENLPYEAAFLAGKCFLKYRKSGGVKHAPLPDFYIGAHAAVRGWSILTRDNGRYQTYFPALRVISPL